MADRYTGTVISYDADNEWYHVRYQDGDKEDLTWKEVGTARRKPTRFIVHCRGRGRKRVIVGETERRRTARASERERCLMAQSRGAVLTLSSKC